MVTGSPRHRLDDGAIGLGLRLLVGQGLAVHEQELGAQQADAGGAGLGDQRQFGGEFQVGLQLHRLAVGGLGRQAAQLGELLLLAREGRHGAPRRSPAWPAPD